MYRIERNLFPTLRDRISLKDYAGSCKFLFPLDEIRVHIARYGLNSQVWNGDPYISQAIKDSFPQWLERLIANCSTVPQDLCEYELKCLQKWYGPQGGTPAESDLARVLSGYYQLPRVVERAPLCESVIYLLRSQCFTHSWVTLTPQQVYHTYKGDHKSNSGVTGWADRRTPSIRKRAISEAMRYPLHIDPLVLGSRIQRNKTRTIFMDSFANQYRSIKQFRFLHDVLASSDLVAWRGDRYVERHITAFCDRLLAQGIKPVFIETDYESYDQNLSEAALLWTWEQISRILDIPQDVYNDGIILIKNLANADVVTPFGVLLGQHALLSGIGITNDFESWHNLMTQLSWLFYLNPDLEYGDDFIIVILGDDAIIVVKDGVLLIPNEQLLTSFTEFVMREQGLLAHPVKQRVSYESGYFCKRRFSATGKRISYSQFTEQCVGSVYPLALAVNTIFYPESTDPMSKAQKLVRIWQVLDNAKHHKLHRAVTRYLFDIYKELHEVTPSQEDEDFANSKATWRVRLYGETFSIAESPTAQLWLSWLL